MNKLLSALVAGLMVTGAMAQITAPTIDTGKSTTVRPGTTDGARSTDRKTTTIQSGSTPSTSATTDATPGATSATTAGTASSDTATMGNTGAADHTGQPCPPGLLKKDNGCLPPGQVGKQLDAPLNKPLK